MTIINLKTEAGLKVVQVVGQEFESTGSDTIPAWDMDIGAYDGSGATINHPFPIPMTKAQYDDIVAFKGTATSRVAGEPFTPPPPRVTLADNVVYVNTDTVTDALDELFTRGDKLERQIEFVEFDEWSMIGTVITGKRGTRAVCRIDLGGDFDIGQVAYNDVAEDDGQRLLTITKGGVVRKFHTWTSNDLHAIQSQANNPQEGEIVSNVLKPSASTT